ncbi:D-amino acid dehydrogenase [Bordetella sp. N]|uniref:D-amino acid dehydrogenase n=1 Tax=Bordetella sp. N TaxID=1746199 RepID=UPI000709D601|nr:D-amino acid dehydrogenase [Bordetella sp. N]ALM84600.1 amino acid dehydrogenase [Bordetella sp. N]
MPHIAIIGAGITGVTSAYALNALGYDVTVVDRNRYAAMETSFANGGQLSASNAEVWNSTSTLIKALGWMWRRNAPLLVNPAPGWHKYSWLAEFIGQIRNHRVNTMETTRLAISAREHLYAMARAENIDFDLERRGILHIYHDARSFAAAQRGHELMLAAGLERHAVTSSEIRDIEPSLDGHYHAGFYTPSDASGDIHKFTRGLSQACERRGVRFLMNTVVDRAQRQGAGHCLHLVDDTGRDAGVLEADAVVVCAGVGSRRVAAMFGDRINVYPVKGYSITVQLDDADADVSAPRVSLLDEAAKIVTSRLGTRFRVAGTAEFNGENRDIRADRIQPLVDWTRRTFTRMSTDRVVPWAGLRPMLPSMMPRVGKGRQDGVFYNTGHGHLGWTLSAATAQCLAGIVGQAVPVPR